MEALAINGGSKAVPYQLPHVMDGTGRRFGDEELKELEDVIRSGILNFLNGTKNPRLEKDFCKRFGVKYAVPVSSGTAALHTAVCALDPEPGDEIITSPITDFGTVIPILYQNAIPIFADVDRVTLNITAEAIAERITDRTVGIIVVHLFGYPCDMDPIMELAREQGLWVIEDCSQAHLTEYKGRLAGTIGDIGCFSFQQSKHMSTGEGGMVVTNDDELGKRARLSADKGWPRDIGRHHLFLAPNYHMTELQAAVAIAQLRKLDWVVETRRKRAHQMTELLQDLPGLALPPDSEEAKHTYWQYPIGINPSRFQASLQEMGEAIRAEGLNAGIGYINVPVYLYKVLTEKRTHGESGCPLTCPWYGKELPYAEGLCPEAEKVLREMYVIPWNEMYTEQMVSDMAKGLRKVFTHFSV